MHETCRRRPASSTMPPCASPSSHLRGSPSRPRATAARSGSCSSSATGSSPAATRCACTPPATRTPRPSSAPCSREQMPDRIGVTPYDARQVSFAFADIEESGFDLVHDHSGFLGVAFSRYLATPMVHTVHCAFDEFAYGFYEQFAQRGGLHLHQRVPALDGAARHELGRPRLQRHRRRAVAVHAREGRLPAGLRPRLRGQGLPPQHRDGQAARPQAHHGRRAAGAVPPVLRGEDRAAHRRRADRVRGRGHATSASASCSRTRTRSSSPSRGRSRSGWS